MTCHADRFGRLPYLEREVDPSLLIDLETYAGLLQACENPPLRRSVCSPQEEDR